MIMYHTSKRLSGHIIVLSKGSLEVFFFFPFFLLVKVEPECQSLTMGMLLKSNRQMKYLINKIARVLTQQQPLTSDDSGQFISLLHDDCDCSYQTTAAKLLFTVNNKLIVLLCTC